MAIRWNEDLIIFLNIIQKNVNTLLHMGWINDKLSGFIKNTLGTVKRNDKILYCIKTILYHIELNEKY